ncbi:hypothetical protein FB451DRAFT_1396979 [Mycena latifolia]|nr:hypothetical protein FB451DRAFT_1396979 [Mycena latifolia]
MLASIGILGCTLRALHPHRGPGLPLLFPFALTHDLPDVLAPLVLTDSLVRISPATTKFKPPPPNLTHSTPLSPPTPLSAPRPPRTYGQQGQHQAPPQPHTQSVSAPIAVPHYTPQQQQTPEYGGGGAQEYFAQFSASQQQQQPAHQQLNGEQLTSTDPYNTTVFVGGLSPLVGEETLSTFFVKVLVGKHCGFMQFVRKADVERAIEKMQRFPVGGNRIWLSWGRSQCEYSSVILSSPSQLVDPTGFVPPHVAVHPGSQKESCESTIAASRAHVPIRSTQECVGAHLA